MKNGLSEILYVGISSQCIWNRWFGWNRHIMEGPSYLLGASTVGLKIVEHLPDSWEWKIQLWTLEDCVFYCKDLLPSTRRKLNIEIIEPYMIQRLSPSLNVIYNLTPGIDTTPKSSKELKREKSLNDMYKKIFDKNK
jgi:hypothetical protein